MWAFVGLVFECCCTGLASYSSVTNLIAAKQALGEDG